jgi:hypothetical protein
MIFSSVLIKENVYEMQRQYIAEILPKKALNSIIIIIFNNFRKTEHNHQQGLRRGKYQGGQRN